MRRRGGGERETEEVYKKKGMKSDRNRGKNRHSDSNIDKNRGRGRRWRT